MKKLLVLLFVTAGVALAKKKMDDGKAEQALWSEATDDVSRA